MSNAETEVRKLVSEFFKGDKEKVDLWYCTPNPMLGGLVPQAMIILGRAERLLKIVRDLLEGNLA